MTGTWVRLETDGLGGSAGAGLGWAGLGWKGVGRGQEFCDWNLISDWNLVLGWVGLEIDGLGGSTPAVTSNFYLFLS